MCGNPRTHTTDPNEGPLVSNVAYRIAFLSDSHLGYATDCRKHVQSGINQRVVDGYTAFKESITQIINADVDFAMHGGDLFHRSWPSVSDIVWARQQLERLSEAGIPMYGNTGNHDASGERGKSPATAAVHDPNRGIHMITDPYARIEPVDGLIIHAVSHYGLAQEERLIPDPADGAVNILTAHGAALVPGHEIFHCADSPGEQPIGLDLLTNDGFAMHLLGHYHGMGEIIDNVWYAGSSIRRGFSDPEGGRGWLLVTVHTDGSVKIDPQYIRQRPQHDLPKIDARGLSGAEVDERIRANLAAFDIDNAILRQVVTNCSTSTRGGIDRPALQRLASDALMWLPDFRRPEVTHDDGERTVEGVGASLKTAGSADLPTMYTGWINDYLTHTDVSPELAPIVVSEGNRHLNAASAGVESGDYTTVATNTATTPTNPAPTGTDVDLADPTTNDTLPVREPAGINAYGLTDTGTDSAVATGTDDEPPF
jgi:DNA repair protein SbcD/Mre11